jgi:hypothetical protein
MMRRSHANLLAVIIAVMGASGVKADESADKLAEQKKAAKANWALLEAGDPAIQETEHLLIHAPKDSQKRLKDLATKLEKSYALAVKTLKTTPKDDLWPGKLTVYLLADKEQFASFIRRVEKRRPQSGELGSQFVDNDMPHAVARPPAEKRDPSLESQAAEQIAAALLRKKIGVKVPLPEWVVSGFGRATVWRTAPTDKAVVAERRQAQTLVAAKKRTAKDIWGGSLEPEEIGVLRGSLADFLAYGPGASKFLAILNGFKPEENQTNRTTAQAFESANVKPETVETTWRQWVLRGGK